MPKIQPTMSYQLIRNYTEKFSWIDRKSGLKQQGFNPPRGAIDVQRVPFFIRFITQTGKLESGYATCIKVDLRRKQRMIQFVESNEIRRVCDYLILEIDGIRFVTH